MRLAPFALVVFFAGAVTAAPEIALEEIVAGLDYPIYATAPPGDPHRLFVLEQEGVIRIVRDGEVLSPPFLDVRFQVNHTNIEQGFFGLAFDPEFHENGHFYVYFTAGVLAGSSRLLRYRVSADRNRADPNSAASILELDQPAPVHNGGHIEFGPDGHLYLALGDGGPSDDPEERAQDLGTLFGKLIRIDVNRDDFPEDPLNNYGIPEDNPFVGTPGARGEIWASGLRNPYRWTFDRRTYDLYLGDVGQDRFEEIDFLPASSPGGENFGWSLWEGSDCFRDPACNDLEPVQPIHLYAHLDSICSAAIAGSVYRGTRMRDLQGHFFFADYCRGELWSLRSEKGELRDLTDWTSLLAGHPHVPRITAIGQDGAGELHLVCREGEILKVLPIDPPLADPNVRDLFSLSAHPNPFRESVALEIQSDRAGEIVADVHSVDGRRVRAFRRAASAGAGATFRWDGRDDRGRPLAPGIYFVRAALEGRVRTVRLTMLQ